MNEQTMKIVNQLKDKLMLAESAEEIKEMIANAGGEITDEDAAKLLAEIKRSKTAPGTEIDDDAMDAVAGGAFFCGDDATDGHEIDCWLLLCFYKNKEHASYNSNTCQDCKVQLTAISNDKKECPVCHTIYNELYTAPV